MSRARIASRELITTPVRVKCSVMASIEEFLNDVQKKSKEDVRRKYELQLSGEPSTVKGNIEELIDALERKDAFAVWKYIANAEERDLKEMKDFSVCRTVIEYEERKQKSCCFRDGLRDLCGWQNVKKLWPWQCECTVISDSSKEAKQGTVSQQRYAPPPIKQQEQEKENEQMKQEEQEDEQKWLTILSDPLYIGLKWLWNTNQQNSTGNENDSRKDVIQNTLHDSYFLEQLAKHNNLYKRDDYLTRASKIEDFAIGVVKQGSSKDLHELMDTDGSGILVHKDNDSNTGCKNRNYSASVHLLQTAAEKGRKKFVSTPKCQRVLDEIIYQDASWQDRNIAVKFIWAFCIHLPLVVILSVLYIPYMLVQLCKKSPRCGKLTMMSCSSCSRCSNSMGGCHNWFHCLLKNAFEHPYSKFVNQTTWYVAFLFLVFSCTFVEKFGTTSSGLSNLDYVMIAFISGYLVTEVSEAYRQGFCMFYSKWWNVVDSTILASFVIAYAMWLIGWVTHDREWKPRQGIYIWSDMFFASASVMAYWHVAHVFQFNSTLGPLQLSLYKMLRDVLKFLLIFLVLYIAFATGLTKIYSFYVASQIKLQSQNETSYESSHPYEKHQNTFLALFWLLLGDLNEKYLDVPDPAFSTTQMFGKIYVTFYIVSMVIVALSALVALMSNSFEKIMENADMEWRFSRTQMWLDIINRHAGNVLPSPLTNIMIVYHLFNLVSHYCYSEREAVKDITHIKDYKKARVETMKRLVVRYLNGYLDEKDQKTKEKEKRSLNKSSSPMESPSVQVVSTANILANIQESIKSLDSQLKALTARIDAIDEYID